MYEILHVFCVHIEYPVRYHVVSFLEEVSQRCTRGNILLITRSILNFQQNESWNPISCHKSHFSRILCYFSLQNRWKSAFQNFSKIIFSMICSEQNWDNDQFWWFLSLFCQETHFCDILRDLKSESIKMTILREFLCNFTCFLWPHWVPSGVPRCWFSEKISSKE